MGRSTRRFQRKNGSLTKSQKDERQRLLDHLQAIADEYNSKPWIVRVWRGFWRKLKEWVK